MLKNYQLKTKLIVMITGMLFLTCVVILAVGVTSLRKAIYEEKEIQTREFVNIGLGIMGHYHEMERQGTLTREQAQ